MISQIMKLCSFSRNSYYVWKREGRPIIQFLEKYFSDEELEEFLEQGSIAKLDNFNNNKTITNIEVLNEVSSLVKKQLEKKINLDAIGMKTVFNLVEDYLNNSNHTTNVKDFSIFYKSIADLQNYYAYDIVEIEIKREKKNFKITDKNKKVVEVELDRRKNYILNVVQNFFDSLNDSELFILLNDYKNLLDYHRASFYLWSKSLS